jgi:hypothetical protein
MANTYLNINNKKAIRHFLNKGYILTVGYKEYQWGDYCNPDNNNLYRIVVWVNWPGSGKSFHRYLVQNGLTIEKWKEKK